VNSPAPSNEIHAEENGLMNQGQLESNMRWMTYIVPYSSNVTAVLYVCKM